MENATPELEQQIRGEDVSFVLQLSEKKRYSRWFRVILYVVFLLVGQSAATLLGRLYYDKGGNSKWMSTLVQSAGFPVLIPIIFFFPKSANSSVKSSSLLLFLFFGILLAVDNLMFSYGLLYLPVSTYSLLCATHLAFNAVFSFLLNSQKFTALIFNSLVLLTISASLLAVHADSDNTKKVVSKLKYNIGFLLTIGASATYSLYLSLVELSFKKVIKRRTFDAVLDMKIYPSFVASCASVIGIFASGESKTLRTEYKDYQEGRVSYIMTLVWIAISWQISSLGLLGVICEVSSLFASVISTVALPAVPILAVIFFHDKMDGVKVISLILAIWGFLSFIYQHYLDEKESKSRTWLQNKPSDSSVELC